MWHSKLIKKGRVDVKEHIQEIIDEYKLGISTRDLAIKYDTTHQWINRWLRRSGVKMRTQEEINRMKAIGVSNTLKGKPHYYMRGKKNWRWKGGTTSLNQQLRHCIEMINWKSQIREKDDYTCQICKRRGGDEEVDHYPKKFSLILKENNIKSYKDAQRCKELWDLNNGRTLCLKCHNKTKKPFK